MQLHHSLSKGTELTFAARASASRSWRKSATFVKGFDNATESRSTRFVSFSRVSAHGDLHTEISSIGWVAWMSHL